MVVFYEFIFRIVGNFFPCQYKLGTAVGYFLVLRLKFSGEDKKLGSKFLMCPSLNFQPGFLGIHPSLFAYLIESADKSPFLISKFECVFMLSITK